MTALSGKLGLALIAFLVLLALAMLWVAWVAMGRDPRCPKCRARDWSKGLPAWVCRKCGTDYVPGQKR